MSIKVNTGQGDGQTPSLYYRGPKDAVVDPNDDASVEMWAKSLEISRTELLEAIKIYGTTVRNIRKGLLNKQDAA